MLISRTPLRLSIGGGGTDLPSYYRQRSALVISAAINRYCYIAVNRTFVDDYFVKYSELERARTIDELRHPIIREALRMQEIGPGIEIASMADIPAGTRLVEYKGRVMTHRQADNLYDGSSETGHTFLFTLNDKYVIDANIDGNSARWINHSCAPNCEAVLDEDEDDGSKSRVFIEAIRAIKPGEELTYDYGITLSERHTPRLKKIWACRCGSKKCTGTMLRPKR